mmetsp:Transcript_25495/g.55710  ORF Transcript_25495/g.55710 Transcript_25495/m.55710 type:complete len:167 (+) Transcript_25495:1075-1575(+)
MMATLPVRSGGEYVSAIVEDEAKDMTRELFVEDAVVGWAACCGDTCNIRSTCCDRPASLLDLLVTILLLPIPKECTCCCCRAARRRKIIGNTHIRVPVRGYRLYGKQNKRGLAGRPLATLASVDQSLSSRSQSIEDTCTVDLYSRPLCSYHQQEEQVSQVSDGEEH